MSNVEEAQVRCAIVSRRSHSKSPRGWVSGANKNLVHAVLSQELVPRRRTLASPNCPSVFSGLILADVRTPMRLLVRFAHPPGKRPPGGPPVGHPLHSMRIELAYFEFSP